MVNVELHSPEGDSFLFSVNKDRSCMLSSMNGDPILMWLSCEHNSDIANGAFHSMGWNLVPSWFRNALAESRKSC